jgi:hypothetical protein
MNLEDYLEMLHKMAQRDKERQDKRNAEGDKGKQNTTNESRSWF